MHLARDCSVSDSNSALFWKLAPCFQRFRESKTDKSVALEEDYVDIYPSIDEVLSHAACLRSRDKSCSKSAKRSHPGIRNMTSIPTSEFYGMYKYRQADGDDFRVYLSEIFKQRSSLGYFL